MMALEIKKKCPKCESTNIREIKYKGNAKRYICRDCKKNFSDISLTAFRYSKLNESTRNKLLRLYAEGIGVNRSAKAAGVAPYTVCKYFKKFRATSSADESH
jgi:transposase-like protein